jgi:molybdenum cofactor biosynthesis protein B
MKSGYAEHQERVAVEGAQTLLCGVITVSDTRTLETDVSGQFVVDQLSQGGHQIALRAIVPDESERITALLLELTTAGCAVIILNGGTGIAKRDSTFEAVDGLLEKRLPGFGELFRMLSFAEIGPAAMLSRATAGVYRGALVFSLPGSPHAVALAMTRLIMPELTHLVWETVRR